MQTVTGKKIAILGIVALLHYTPWHAQANATVATDVQKRTSAPIAKTSDQHPSRLGESQLDMLISAVKRGDVAWLQNRTSARELINERDASGFSALHYAAENNHVPMVKWLLQAGADPALTTPFGMTPLALAIRSESLAAIHELLLSKKTKVNQQFPLLDDITPLMLAVIQRNREIIDTLLRNGADPNLKNAGGASVMHFFARMNSRFLASSRVSDYSSIGRALLAAHANINDQTLTGNTPLMTAVEHGNSSAVMFLVEHGASINAVNNQGKTAYNLADRQLADYLLKKGARPHKE